MRRADLIALLCVKNLQEFHTHIILPANRTCFAIKIPTVKRKLFTLIYLVVLAGYKLVPNTFLSLSQK